MPQILGGQLLAPGLTQTALDHMLNRSHADAVLLLGDEKGLMAVYGSPVIQVGVWGPFV